MKLEFIRDWRGNAAGEIKDVDGGVGEAYIARGVARIVKQDGAKPTLTAVAPKRGRGRPRKNPLCLTS